MANYVQHRHVEHIEEYRLSFDFGPGRAGYSFPCDKHGNVFVDVFHGPAAENYAMCIASGKRSEVVDRSYSYTHPDIIECELCELPVTLDGFTNTCDCGADYNLSGQRLAPRSQWGEETGESLSDILGPGEWND